MQAMSAEGAPLPTTAKALAHAYADAGLRVVPIPPGRKHPPLAAWQDAATTDHATIDAWWNGLYADHGIGLAPDRLPDGRWWFVVDIDQHGIDGEDQWRDFCDAYGFDEPATVEAITGGGGRHLLYASPVEIRNAKLCDGVDIRGHGGQIVVEPSIHPTGQPYGWVDGHSPTDRTITDGPAPLIGVLTATPDPTRTLTPSTRTDRPGDQWSAANTWADLLTPDGWTLVKVDRDGESYWCRPGKDPRDGASATTGHGGSDVLKVFTTSHPTLTAEATYTKLGYLAATRHDGDHAAAARSLREQGYGDPAPDADGLGLTGLGNRPWETPRTVTPHDAVPPFPLDALPAWMADYIVAAAHALQVPVDLTATLAIGALAAAATGRANIHVTPEWSEPLALYLVSALRSGAGKSPAHAKVARWLDKWEAEQLEATQGAHDRAMVQVRNARKLLARLDGTGIGGDDLMAAFDAIKAAEAEVPELPRLLIDDVTPEAVATLLAAHGQRLAITSTEADLFDLLLRGKTGQRANVNIFLKAWSGDTFRRDRKGGSETGPESMVLTRPLLSCSITVQPSVLARVISDAEMVSRGLATRFMVSMPDDLIGSRDRRAQFAVGKIDGAAAYEDTCRRLAERWSRWANPADLRLTKEAEHAVQDYLVEQEPRLAKGQDLERLAEWANKITASALRYAGLLHLCEDGDTAAPITGDTMARALRLGDYWIAHAHAVIGMTADLVVTQAQTILTYVAERCDPEFTPAQLQNAIRRPGEGLDKVKDFVPGLQLLIELGWIRPVDKSNWSADLGVKGSKSPRFALWPDAVGMSPSVVEPNEQRTELWESAIALSSLTPPPTPGGSLGPLFSRFSEPDGQPVDNSEAVEPPEVQAPETDWMDL